MAASVNVSASAPAAAALAQGRLCAELAIAADEAGERDKETIALYTAAVEHYMAALKLDADDSARVQHRARLTMLLERAEALKQPTGCAAAPGTAQPLGAAPAAAPSATPSAALTVGPTPMPPPTPPSVAAAAPKGASSAGLSSEEKEVLARSSKISGALFYPWLGDGQRERFHYDTPWEDPDGLLPLSAKQRQHFGRWARPSQFVRGEPRMIYLVSSLSITQTIITDCSFVSSLVIAAAYERRHGKQLITKTIWPQDSKGVPIYNPAGKYLVKLHVNGIARKVLVDDRLPLSKDGQLMTSHTTHGQELWVSLIEKAYMKLNGGYDFPGSNSGIDMFALTGWIPEQFRTDDKDFDRQRLWERMRSASRYGDCLLTVATGELAELGGQEEEKIGLVRTHAYAVLQVREACGERLVQLKNPWAKVRWKGAYSVHDTQRWTRELRQALDYDQTSAMQHDNGVFWIDYTSLLRFFQGVYLNWNPALFAHTTTHHGQWPKRHPGDAADDTANLGRNPQYALSVTVPVGSKPAAVWLLLTRHTRYKDQGKDDFLAVHVFRGERGGYRVYYLEESWKMGIYSNRPHCLVQFDLPPGTHKLTLALAQYKPVAHQVDYTLKVFSMTHFNLRPLPYAMRHTERHAGKWKGLTAGGCANFDSVVDNPRYSLVLDSPADVQLELTSPAQYSVGLELHPLDAKLAAKPLASSGSYRKGFCLLEARAVPAGRYALAASTFEAGQEGSFSLLISASVSVGCRPLAPEGHGLERHTLRGEWLVGSTAAGCPNHGRFHDNPHYLLKLSRRSDVLFRLRLADLATAGGRRAALGVDVWKRTAPLGADESRGRTPPMLSSNGGIYSYPPGGALLPRSTLDAGTYVLVPSTFDPLAVAFELIIYAEGGALQLEKLR